MPSNSKADSYKAMYKGRKDREAQASISNRLRRKRKDEEINKRRGLPMGISTLSESFDDQGEDIDTQGSQTDSDSTSKSKTSSGSECSTKTDSRALSLKEKLQKWREQKQKQADLKKKQQPPAFVVKTVEHKSDLCLYGASSKNTKKPTKPELNINFVERNDKPVKLIGKAIKPALEEKKTSAPQWSKNYNQSSEKPSQTDAVLKRAQEARTTRQRQSVTTAEPHINPSKKVQVTRTTRQTVKTAEPSIKPSKAEKTLTHTSKSAAALGSSAQESKSKSRPLRGDLHSRLTAAAAAKMQENAGKPKEFLRAKPHRVITGRATRSQAKQAKSECDLQEPNKASSTLNHSTSEKADKPPKKSQALPNVSDPYSEICVGSPAKRPRKEDTAEQSTELESESNDTASQPEKVGSAHVRRTRRSVFSIVKSEEEIGSVEKTTPFSKKEAKNLLSNDVLPNMEEAMSVDQGELNMDEVDHSVDTHVKRTPGRKCRASQRLRRSILTSSTPSAKKETGLSSDSMALIPGQKLQAEEQTSSPNVKQQIGENNGDQITPLRKSRRSMIGTASAVRSSRRLKAKNVSEMNEESTNLPSFNSATSDKEDMDEITKSVLVSQEKQMVDEPKVKTTSVKRSRRSVLNKEAVQEDQVNKQEFISSQEQTTQSADDSVPELTGEEFTNLAIVLTPGKSPGRSVHKLPLREDTPSDSSTNGIQIRTSSSRKSQCSVAKPASVPVGQLTLMETDSDSSSGSNIMKVTPGRKSCYSTAGSVSKEEPGSESEMDLSLGNKFLKVTPGRTSRLSVVRALAIGEPALNDIQPIYDSILPTMTTPGRKSRRSVATPKQVDLMSANSDSDSSTSNTMKATPGRKSRRSVVKTPALKKLETSPSDTQIVPIVGDVNEEQQILPDNNDKIDTQTSPDIQESGQSKGLTSRGSFGRRSSGFGINTSGGKRKSGRKTTKSARRSSRARSRSSATASALFSPLSRRSTVVSVSEEGTSKWKGENVIDQAMTPNSSFAENKLPLNECGTRRSTRRSMTSKDSYQTDGKSDSSAYRLAKPAVMESETGPLQELTVEKVDGETSYIEVPLDESDISMTTASPVKTPKLIHQESIESTGKASEPTSGNSSVETRPFTPRRSCNVTRYSQESMPSVEATPNLPPRVAVRGFKTPCQAPLSAARAKGSSTRLRRNTEHRTPAKSPEEMIKILEKSPMVEMTRRRSRHVSSPATMLATHLNLDDKPTSEANTSAPELTGMEVDPEVITLAAGSGKDDLAKTSECSDGESPVPDPHVIERVKHFRDLLVSETDRLNQLCKTWDEISTYTFGLSEDILGQIRTTVGKAQLLIAQRFKQFSGLVDNCEFNLGEQKTRPEDLQGFWEMIYFQVEDVNGLFGQLKTLQDNNWEKQKSPPKLTLKKKAGPGKAAKPKGVSNFKAFRQEMMKRKAQKTTGADEGMDPTAPAKEQQKQAKQPNVEFDGGFFKVTSPARLSAGRRATLGSYTNTPKATAPNPDADAKAEISNQPQRSPNSSTPVAANKENQEAQRAGSTPVSAGTPRSQAKFSMSAKRLSYVPVIPSPLLKDTTGITKQQKL